MLVAVRYRKDGTIDEEETIKASLKYNRFNRNSSKGMADVIACIGGQFYAIEIKNRVTRDRQSDAQKSCELKVTAAGGCYVIVKTFEQFYDWLKMAVKH